MSNWLSNTDFIWCPGCPNSWLAMSLAKVFNGLGLKKKNTWLVSGIGCVGRIANYFSCNTAHTTHGRAIPVAEGIKLTKPKSDVFVVSGDGDLLSIGLSHLIHTARRNTPIKVICLNNSIYAMTGGQTSPTTPKGVLTGTHPAGSSYSPLEPKKLFTSFPKVFFSRTIVYNLSHFAKIIEAAYQHPGFAFVEVISFCRVNDPRFKKAKSQEKEIRQFLSGFKIR